MADASNIEIVRLLSPEASSIWSGSSAHDSELLSSTELNRMVEETVEMMRRADKFEILTAGKTGTGKSTLVNGLVGRKVAEVSELVCRTGLTTELVAHRARIKGLDVTVYDSPGLQDGTDNEDRYLEEIALQCGGRDLVLYCISMLNPRFVVDNMDIRAMKKLTERFGSRFWTNTIIVLTFANAAVSTFLADVPKAEKAEKFADLHRKWDQLIKTALVEEAGVEVDIANNISVVPAGHRKRSLPGHSYWLSDLWEECLNAIPSVEGRVALVKLSSGRFTSSTETDFDRKPVHDHPIVIDHRRRRLRNSIVVGCVVGIAGAAAAGAAAGAGVGVAAAGLGVFVGLPVGLAVGVVTGTVGAVLTYNTKRKKTKTE